MESEKNRSVKEILRISSRKALAGGFAGAMAQGMNVLLFMPLRTTMNFQYRHGGGLIEVAKSLKSQGGISRFYRGIFPALIQSPLSRFGDTAANTGVLSILCSFPLTCGWPVGAKTAIASATAAWRFCLMPIDTWKTVKQVQGSAGLAALCIKVRTHGISKLYHGSVANLSAAGVGHYPWFATYNILQEKIPNASTKRGNQLRHAAIGFCSSLMSDTCSNSLRVLKTNKQTSVTPLTYKQAINALVKTDGFFKVATRGLKTRIITNGMQGMCFSVGWKVLQDLLDARQKRKS